MSAIAPCARSCPASRNNKKDAKPAAAAPAKEAKKDAKPAAAPAKDAKAPAKADAKKADAPKKQDAKPAAAPAAKEAPKAAAKAAPAAKKEAPAAAALGDYPAAPTLKRVPETLLKRRRRAEALAKSRAEEAVAAKRRAVEKKREAFVRAEKYVKEARASERSLIRMRRMAKAAGNFFAEPEAKLLFVIRIRGTQGIDPRSRKILQLLRLRQVHNGVFVKANSASLEMLRLVRPYITWGTPSLSTIKQLVYKRGFLKINRQRIPITDNTVVEQALGAKNIICVEDLIHEIATVGPAFKEANNALWPFKLSSPRGGFENIKRGWVGESGDAGSREGFINQLIAQMN